jgi:hypothetical protein
VSLSWPSPASATISTRARRSPLLRPGTATLPCVLRPRCRSVLAHKYPELETETLGRDSAPPVVMYGWYGNFFQKMF